MPQEKNGRGQNDLKDAHEALFEDFKMLEKDISMTSFTTT